MKLRNFMYATMIACAFASCSKDDVVGPDGPDTAKGDADFTIQVDANNLVTKAALPTDYKLGTGEGQSYTLDGEASIKNITLVVFDKDGKYLAHAASSTAETKELKIAGLVPQQIQFIVFANMSISNIPTLSASDLTGTNVTLTADYFDVANDGLPMSSQLVTNKTLASGNNYYGYTTEESQDGTNLSTTPLPLNRNVARVEIADVFLDMAQSDYVSGSATFQFTGVKINNAANKVKISGVDTGAGHVSYNASDYSFYGDFSNAIEAVSQNSFTSETSPISAKPIKAYYYVLANTQISAADGAATTLVVEGKFSLSGAKMAGSDQVYDLASADATYPIVVGVTGMGTPVNIENNKVYRITLYVAGPGKTGTGGDRANFFVKCAVADWTAVNQSAVIK